jgi:hypothetical protein
MVVESFSQGVERSLEIEEVDNEACARINRALHSNFNPIGVAVHAVASVLSGDVWQAVRSFKCEGLRDFHRTPIALWV